MKVLYVFAAAMLSAAVLSSCHNKAGGESVVAKGGLADSVRDSGLKTEISQDSLELLDVIHDLVGGQPVEHVVYFDHHVSRNTCPDPNKIYAADRENFPLPDSVRRRINPFRKLNGCYLSVVSYRGSYVVADISDDLHSQSEVIVTDSALLWHFMMPEILLYDTGYSQGEHYTFVVTSTSHQMDTVEVKKIGGPLDLTLWRWPGFSRQFTYILRAPRSQTANLPTLVERNNLGVESAYPVPLDAINYDSLWAKY